MGGLGWGGGKGGGKEGRVGEIRSYKITMV